MHPQLRAVVVALCLCGVFAAGVAVGKNVKQARFTAREEVRWMETPLKMGVLTGDKDKGPHVTLVQLAGGFESAWHSHSGDYEAVEISGTTRHWFRGEDSAKAKKMTPGSYWMIPGGIDHVSACDKGADCLLVIWQKTKFDAIPGKDAAKPPAPPAKPATTARPAKPAAK